jgi:site-specific recombinase XerD
MRDQTMIGPWVRRFLLEYLITDRNLARNTQISYRDTLVLLLPYLNKVSKKLNRTGFPRDSKPLEKWSHGKRQEEVTKVFAGSP